MGSPNAALTRHFDEVMGHSPAPLFENYETYKSSLPVRKILKRAEPLKLVDLPFFARDEDLQVTMKRLELQSDEPRSVVRYAVSPTCTGKTACICPAFLMSAARSDDDREEKKFSHYLYLAFSNNHGRHFFVRNESDISKTRKLAEIQGAVFIVNCLRKLLNCEFGPVAIPSEDDIADKTVESIAKECQELLDSSINPGRILVHLDEHRKMNEENPHFRRGALSVIGYEDDSRAVVVATYVDVPTEVSSEISSGVCRYAVPVPVLDVNSALQYAGCIVVPPEGLDRNQKRFLATLKFRIAAYLSSKMPTFHLAYSISEETANSSPTKGIRQVMQIYGNCVNNSMDPRSYRAYWKSESDEGESGLMASFIKLTTYYTCAREIDEHVMQLFLGVTEQFEFSHRLKSHLVSIAFIPEGKARLTYGLQDLVAKVAPPSNDGARAYSTAQTMFFNALMAQEVEDLLSGRPLERAYLWSLATMSAHFGEISLESFSQVLSLNFKCRKVDSGRIFTDDTVDLSSMSAGWMQPETIYYAHEGELGLSSHPLGDIFFLTTDNELVLIDITASGQGSNMMTRKRKHSKRFIDAWRSGGSPALKLVVAHISPLEEGWTKTSDEYPELRYIYGSSARELLGGLAQFLAWY